MDTAIRNHLTAETRARLTACHVLNTTVSPDTELASDARHIDWSALAARLLPPALIGVALAVLMIEWGRYLLQ